MSLIDDVRDAVRVIPAGSVASYGDLAEQIGVGARQVGHAMSMITDESVPWWRVVHADGTPASCHNGRAAALLRSEGTPMNRSRVAMDLARTNRSWAPDGTSS